jgi:hypothetical protein
MRRHQRPVVAVIRIDRRQCVLRARARNNVRADLALLGTDTPVSQRPRGKEGSHRTHGVVLVVLRREWARLNRAHACTNFLAGHWPVVFFCRLGSDGTL